MNDFKMNEENFKKITTGLNTYIKTFKPFYLGNVNSFIDETHTIKEFIDECLQYIFNRNNYEWRLDEKGREILWDTFENRLIIGIDDAYYRPAEVDILLGDASKAKEKLGWEAKTKFKDLVEIMMKHELNLM